MDYFEQFNIPVKGMNTGIHEYFFDIDNEFFNGIKDSLISEGDYKVKLKCDKRERMLVLDFEISGTYKAICDRCLANIEIPTLIDYTVYLKYGFTSGENNDSDVIFIDENDHIYNLTDMIYQIITLSMPMQSLYDCQNDPNPRCDFEMLKRLENQKEETNINPIWAKLKNINNN